MQLNSLLLCRNRSMFENSCNQCTQLLLTSIPGYNFKTAKSAKETEPFFLCNFGKALFLP